MKNKPYCAQFELTIRKLGKRRDLNLFHNNFLSRKVSKSNSSEINTHVGEFTYNTEPNAQSVPSAAIVATSSVKEQHHHHHQQQQYSSSSQMMSSSKRTAKISNASTVSNASSNLTVPNALCGLSDDEGTYQALSVVFEDSTNPRKKSKG